MRNSVSGINCTLFGGTSQLGMTIGATLSLMGSTMIYPYRNAGSIWEFKFKEVKPTADLGYKAYVNLKDFTNMNELRHVIRDQNVVVSTIGSRVHYNKESDYEDANIRIPMAIAKAAKENPNVKRFIHLSAAGADPNS